MENFLAWLADNALIIAAAFYFIEKIVKETPTDKDDILLDMIIKPLLKVFGVLSNDNDEEGEK